MAGRRIAQTSGHVPVPIPQMPHEQIVGALTRTRNMLIQEFRDGDLSHEELNHKLREIGLPEYGKGKCSVAVIRLSIEHDPDERPAIDRVESTVSDMLGDFSQFLDDEDAWSVEDDGLLSVTWEAPN